MPSLKKLLQNWLGISDLLNDEPKPTPFDDHDDMWPEILITDKEEAEVIRKGYDKISE